MNPFLAGLSLGGLAGLALGPALVRLLRFLALGAVVGAVWLVTDGGSGSLEAAVALGLGWLGPHGELAGGAALGMVLGSALAGLLPTGGKDRC